MKLAPPPHSLVELTACPVCGLNLVKPPLYILQHFNVYRCHCGLEFISPCLTVQEMISIYSSTQVLQKTNPVLKDYYNYDGLDPEGKTYQDYDRALNELSSLTHSGKLLEVGCGRGGLLRLAKQKGWEVLGIDSSSDNIKEIQKYGIPGFCEDFLKYGQTNKFDVVVLWDLIEHPTDPARYIQKSWELLNDDGLLVIATPHYPNLLSMAAKWIYKLSFGKCKFPMNQLYFLEHTTYFSAKVLRQFLEASGFNVVKIYKTATDLKRYNFSTFWRFTISIAFWIARLLQLDNRVIVIARKNAS